MREAPTEIGRVHPISQVIDELTAIFADMGFAVAEWPDIETDDYNFTKLNFPEGHPAREMHDTFFLNPGPADTMGWDMNDSTKSVGMAAVFTVKEGQGPYKMLRLKPPTAAEKAESKKFDPPAREDLDLGISQGSVLAEVFDPLSR